MGGVGVRTRVIDCVVTIVDFGVGLEGPFCQRDLHCEDPNAVCNYHKCRCREGYYQKGHICRQNCPPSNFGCLELGTLGRGPECVPRSQVCDSIMQCADGSDEFNCPESGAAQVRPWQQPQQQQRPALKETAQQQQQQQPPSLPHQQPSYPQGYKEPGYGYSEQSMVAPGRPPTDMGSYQAFPQPQTYGHGVDGSYGGYNSQPEQSPQQQQQQQQQQPYLFPGSDQFQRGSLQSSSYLPGSNAKLENAAPSEQYAAKERQGTSDKEPGSASQQQQPPSSQQQQQQEAKTVQTSQKTVQPQRQSPVSPQQAVHQPVPQSANSQQLHPQQSLQTHHNALPQQADLNSQPQQLPERAGGSHQSYQLAQQPSKATAGAGQPMKQPAADQSFPNHNQPPPYQPVGPQQVPTSKVKGGGGGQQTQQTPIKSDPSSSTRPSPSRPAPGQIFVEGGGSVNGQPVDSAAHSFPSPKQQDVSSKKVHHLDSNVQSAPSKVLNPVHPDSSAKSAAAASDLRGGRKPVQIPHDLIDDQKSYIAAGHSKAQSSADSPYQLPEANSKPEPVHPHTAYDVRIGEPGMGRQQTGVIGQPSFLNPTELNNLDTQGSSRFLDTFGNQYLPGQGYGQQYSQYGRYPNTYSQNSGGRLNGYGGLPDQLYPGGQGQRLYPQQGYLDLGYQSPQYEFGEFDPAYPETDSFPAGHDLPSYRPGSKLGYDSHYKPQGVPDKNDKSTLQEEDTDRLGANSHVAEKPETPAKQLSQVSEPSRHVSTSDNKGKSTAQHASSSTHNTQTKSHSKPSEKAKESHPKPTPAQDKLAETKPPADNIDDGFPASKGVSDLAKESSKDQPPAFDGKSSSSSGDPKNLIERQNSFISKLKLEEPKEVANMQGPIIALSLGLAFTVILLVFVACRLRTVRRRLRKGRPLHSNEADYLINGMYL
ncbi:uncharacterized protein LOC143280916 isoform X2 [Babylonia areolata]|uniref:uncharacterized protein LOC143280916 isoform X2 n=1 Tax=Babylonia areolata TaxID=304850 RepID=UPI003FD3F26A